MGFLGALVIFFVIPGLWFVVLDGLDLDAWRSILNDSSRIGRTMFLAVTVYLVLLFCSLSTLAFEYVPMGEVFKWLTIVSFVSISFLLVLGPFLKRFLDKNDVVVLSKHSYDNFQPTTLKLLLLIAIISTAFSLVINGISGPPIRRDFETKTETFTITTWNVNV